MPGIAEIGAELAEAALTFVPALEGVPVLGRILRLIAPGGGNDFEAITQLEAQALRRKTDRATRIARQARYVLKASDAMQCVEDNLMTGGFLLAFGKAIVATVAGRAGGFIPGALDTLLDRIFACIESKVLKQTSHRVKKEAKYYGRPAKGHGHGHITGTSPPPQPPPQPLPPTA